MGRRGAGLLALAGALAALLALQGQAAGAPTCTINWTGPAGGNWSVASNWTVVSGGSHRVPLGNDNVCVTAAGAAVVVDSNQTVGSLIVGTAGATPDQKVTVSGSNVQLFASDFFIEGTGVVELGAGGGGSYTALNGGNVTNNGTLRSVAGTGWRAVWSSLVNNGTFTVAADTHLDGSSKTYTNAGTITVADAIPVTFAGNTLTQKDGATLTNDGEITGPDSTLRLAGGQLNGANPIELSGTATLQYAADATETVPGEVDVVGNTTTVKGDVPTGSTLRLLARDDLAVANFAAVTTESSVTNRGTIVLDSAANGYYPRLQGLKMVNAGTISLVKGTPGGDRHRYLSSQLDNQGTLTASGDVQALYGSTQSLINEGTFTVGSSASLSLSTSSTLDQRGTLAVNGSFVTDADDTLRIASTATSASGTLEMHGGT